MHLLKVCRHNRTLFLATLFQYLMTVTKKEKCNSDGLNCEKDIILDALPVSCLKSLKALHNTRNAYLNASK